VINRSGIIVADTGVRAGVAVASLDLARTKDIYHLTFQEDRRLFKCLADAGLKPAVHRGTKRKIRVSVATVGFGHGPNPRPDSEFAGILDEAGSRASDLIVMSEFGLATDDGNGKQTLALVADKARKYQSYIVIGGLRDPQIPYRQGGRASWAYLWDRKGEVAGKYRISQYGDSVELPVFQTDFGVLGITLCGDIYSQEITRALALQGAEIVCTSPFPRRPWPTGCIPRKSSSACRRRAGKGSQGRCLAQDSARADRLGEKPHARLAGADRHEPGMEHPAPLEILQRFPFVPPLRLAGLSARHGRAGAALPGGGIRNSPFEHFVQRIQVP
jgi:hypothetical protein